MTGPGTPTMRGEYCEFTFPDGSRCVFGARHTVRYHHSETGLDASALPVEGMHVGRSWTGHHLEDSCPCPQEPCGLVSISKADPSCPEHPEMRAKTIRRSHPASECPGREEQGGQGDG